MLAPFVSEEDHKIICSTIEGSCQIYFYLTAANNPEWQTVWRVTSYENNGIDKPFDTMTIIHPAPTKAYTLTCFSFPVQPGFAYVIARDDRIPQDTALGSEVFQHTILISHYST